MKIWQILPIWLILFAHEGFCGNKARQPSSTPQEDFNAKIVVDPSEAAISGLSWNSLVVPVQEGPGISAPVAIVTLQGRFSGKDSALLYDGHKVSLKKAEDNPDQQVFTIEVPLAGNQTPGQIAVVNALGETQSQGILLEFDQWEKWKIKSKATPRRVWSIKPSFGMSGLNFNQYGAFGTLSNTSLLFPVYKIQVAGGNETIKFDMWFEFYTASLNTDFSGAAGLKDNRKFQNLGLSGTYDFLYAGVQGRLFPIGLYGIGTSIQWTDFAVYDVLFGLHALKKEFGSVSHPFLLGLDVSGSIPLSGSYGGGTSVSGVFGYSLAFKASLQKSIRLGKYPLVLIGIEETLSVTNVQFTGSWQGISGTNVWDAQEAKTLLNVEVRL